MASLHQKRIKTGQTLIQATFISCSVTFSPTPGLEIPKQIILSAAELGICYKIWNIYFEEDIQEKKLLEMFREMGFVYVVGGSAGYLVLRGFTGIFNELLDWVPPLGPLISAIMDGSTTAVLGVIWWYYCDTRYSKRISSLI